MSTPNTFSLLEHLEGLLGEYNRGARAARSSECLATKHDLEQLEGRLNVKQTELAAGLKALAEQAKKAKQEELAALNALKEKITALETAITDADVSQDVTDAFAEVKTALQDVDDINADPAATEAAATT